jgi:ubiquinone/menaquinone biosynthesis C-methylase UbiE
MQLPNAWPMPSSRSPECDILDLCCGQGALTALLAERGATAHGLDFSPAMLAVARQRAPSAILREGDAQDLPYPDASFDGVTCNFGVLHIADRAKMLSEVRRVLRHNGLFGFSTWGAPEINPAHRIIFGAVRANLRPSSAPPQPDLFQFADRNEATRMLATADLRLESVTEIAQAWVLDRPEGLFEIFRSSAVGLSMLVKSLPVEQLEAIEASVREQVAGEYVVGDGFRVPVISLMLVARAVG